mmetsp:Transcript_83241/g.156649  ORF Transcript_83241/g.156649 Transcript_83241/m.156649 type:complete len:317 (-) Transcript_83241:34-984(-)
MMGRSFNIDKFASKLNFLNGQGVDRDKKEDDSTDVEDPEAATPKSNSWLSRLTEALPEDIAGDLGQLTQGLAGVTAGAGKLTQGVTQGVTASAGKLTQGLAGVTAGMGLAGVTAAASAGMGFAGVTAAASAAAQKGVQSAVAGSIAATRSAGNVARSASTSISEVAISRRTWSYFFGYAFLGTMLISLAFGFLPMIVFAPQKFALLFTLGSLCFLSSFSVLRGHSAFIRHLLSRSRALFTVTYATSMVGTLWASLVYRSYVLTMLFSIVQVCVLAWFLVSYIPGGRQTLRLFTGIGWRMAKGCCFFASRSSSLLPF